MNSELEWYTMDFVQSGVLDGVVLYYWACALGTCKRVDFTNMPT